MKVYISGVISKGGTLATEKIQANLEKFEAARLKLVAAGHEPWSPPHHVPGGFQPSTTYAQWLAYMRLDIKALMDCEAIYKLEGWEESRGACLEVQIAR